MKRFTEVERHKDLVDVCLSNPQERSVQRVDNSCLKQLNQSYQSKERVNADIHSEDTHLPQGG